MTGGGDMAKSWERVGRLVCDCCDERSEFTAKTGAELVKTAKAMGWRPRVMLRNKAPVPKGMPMVLDVSLCPKCAQTERHDWLVVLLGKGIINYVPEYQKEHPAETKVKARAKKKADKAETMTPEKAVEVIKGNHSKKAAKKAKAKGAKDAPGA